MTDANEVQGQMATRTVEDEIEIAAPVEAVWRALTEAEELARWFPTEAQVTPGVGGEIRLVWGDMFAWDQHIHIWEPGEHLRTTYVMSPSDADPEAEPLEIAIDFHLEAKAGGTVLRVVHSGFGSDAPWDKEYHGVMRGWRYELQSLQHYLERHPGLARRVAWVTQAIKAPTEVAWDAILSADGFLPEGELAALRPGQRYSFRTATGDVFRGVVKTIAPPYEFSGTVENLGDALFRIGVEHFTKGEGLVAILWLATYGLSQVQVDELEARFRTLLEGLFER
jgi:uncharacterized protein YndB with AHSA1/START domain